MILRYGILRFCILKTLIALLLSQKQNELLYFKTGLSFNIKDSDAKIILHDALKTAQTGSYEFLNSIIYNNSQKIDTVLLLAAFDSITNNYLGGCLAQRLKLQNDFKQNNKIWKNFQWKIKQKSLECYISDEKPTKILFSQPVMNLTLKIENAPKFCLRNFVVNNNVYFEKTCLSTYQFKSFQIFCSCSNFSNNFLTLKRNESQTKVIRSTASELSIPKPITFPIFRPIQTAEAFNIDSNNDVENLNFSELKTENLNNIFNSTNSKKEIFNNKTNFTQETFNNSNKSKLEILNIEQNLAENNSVIYNSDIKKCDPVCKMGGKCVEKKLTNGIKQNICECQNGVLGLNCNVKDPCLNSDKCSMYGLQTQCIFDKEIMQLEAPENLFEAPHVCLCLNNNEWIECKDKLEENNFNRTNITYEKTNLDEIEFFEKNMLTTKIYSSSVNFFSNNSTLENFTFLQLLTTSISPKTTETKKHKNFFEQDTFKSSNNSVDNVIDKNYSKNNSILFDVNSTVLNETKNFQNLSKKILDLTLLKNNSFAPFHFKFNKNKNCKNFSSLTKTEKKKDCLMNETLFNTFTTSAFVLTDETTIAKNFFTSTDLPNNINKKIIFENFNKKNNIKQIITQNITNLKEAQNFTILINKSKENLQIDNISTTTFLPFISLSSKTLKTPVFLNTQLTHNENFTNDKIKSNLIKNNELTKVENTSKKKILKNDSIQIYNSEEVSQRLVKGNFMSWIIAVFISAFFISFIITSTLCIGRFVRQSRRLHGKYNPAKEENAVAATYSMPMTSVSKEERLI